MEKKSNGLLKGLLIAAGVIATVAGTIAVLFKVLSKFFKITIELDPEVAEEKCCDEDECCCEEAAEAKEEEIKVEIVDDEVKE